MISNRKEKEEYIKAANAVCANCVKLDQEVCGQCPVRKSVDYYQSFNFTK